MKQLRALLVGVTDYTGPAPSPTIATNRPSAALDVATVMEMLEQRSSKSADTEVWTLTSAGDTTLASIQEGLEWLFHRAGREHQLLFYFSGHGLLRPINRRLRPTSRFLRPLNRLWRLSSSLVRQNSVEEVLLPSDTDWNARVLQEADVFKPAEPALAHGASLEVVLEACSAMAFVGTPPPEHKRPFGCFLGNEDNAGMPAAVWAAAEVGEHSWSAPVPAKEDVPIRGLFTHYFCSQILGAQSRQDLLTAVGSDLNRHGSERKTIPCERKDIRQVPGLFCSDAMADLAPFDSSTVQVGPRQSPDCGFRRGPHL